MEIDAVEAERGIAGKTFQCGFLGPPVKMVAPSISASFAKDKPNIGRHRPMHRQAPGRGKAGARGKTVAEVGDVGVRDTKA